MPEALLHKSYVPVSEDFVGDEVLAVLGGNSIYLCQDNDWPLCSHCQDPLIPILHLPLFGNHPEDLFPGQDKSLNPIAQFLVCSDLECFETRTVGAYNDSWRLQIISALAPDVVYVGLGESLAVFGGRTMSLDEGGNWAVAHTKLTEEDLFKPLHLIGSWTEARLEVVHQEDHADLDVKIPDEFYEEHKPLEGIKLLGYPVKAKYKAGNWGGINWGCPLEEENCGWRCLIQLGSHDVEPELLGTVGNCWIFQCERHPNQLAFGMAWY